MAELDLADIADYTVDIWGPLQADLYLNSLFECIDRIAQLPGLGRPADALHLGFRRIEQGKHVIFYRVDSGDGIFIARVLHQSMLPTRQSLMEGGTETKG